MTQELGGENALGNEMETTGQSGQVMTLAWTMTSYVSEYMDLLNVFDL